MQCKTRQTTGYRKGETQLCQFGVLGGIINSYPKKVLHGDLLGLPEMFDVDDGVMGLGRKRREKASVRVYVCV